MKDRVSTDVNGAAEQRAPLHGSADDAEQVGGGFSQVVHLRHATCEVLEAFRRAATWQGLVTTVQSETQRRFGLQVTYFWYQPNQ